MATKSTKTTKKRPVTRKKTTAKSKSVPMRSFRVAKEEAPFTSLRVTRQTVYWVILIAFIIFTQLWILRLQMDVSNLTDSLVNETETSL